MYMESLYPDSFETRLKPVASRLSIWLYSFRRSNRGSETDRPEKNIHAIWKEVTDALFTADLSR